MKTIYKYPLKLADSQEIEMPGRPTLFKVGLDPAGELCVWAMVNPIEAKRKMEFFVVGTGRPVPPEAYLWLGTVTIGSFVWHIFTP